jgi:hypothetical protein
MKNKNYHTVGPVPKSNRNILERVKVDSLTDIYMIAHFTFFIQATSIKSCGVSEVRVTRSLVLSICFVDRCLSFCTLSFGLCVVGVLGYRDSDYPFCIFKLLII